MSVVSIGWRAHLHYPLILLYNRTERHDRPTAPAHAWPESEGDLLAGRDLKGGGTWLGVNRKDGRFAFVTGMREAGPGPAAGSVSLGRMPVAFFDSGDDPVAHARKYARDKGPYAPFNLIIGNPRQAYYAATRSRVSLPLTEGVHFLSNGLLDQKWPNTDRLDTVFGAYLRTAGGFVTLMDGYPKLSEALSRRNEVIASPDEHFTVPDVVKAGFTMLSDRVTTTLGLPSTGLDPDEEERHSAPFVIGPEVGTRSSTVLVMARTGEVHFEERSFDAQGDLTGTVVEQWSLDPAVFGAND